MNIFKSNIFMQVHNSPMNVFLASLALADLLLLIICLPLKVQKNTCFLQNQYLDDMFSDGKAILI